MPLNLHYKGGRVKAEIALAKGKAEHDKRNTEKDREWEREGPLDEAQSLIKRVVTGRQPRRPGRAQRKGRLMRHNISAKS